jgi:hypothetical protein
VSRHGLAVVFDMGFGCFRSVVHGVFVVAAGQVGMMCRGLMFSRFMVLSGFLVVSCGVFVMLGRLMMMFSCFLGHAFFSDSLE